MLDLKAFVGLQYLLLLNVQWLICCACVGVSQTNYFAGCGSYVSGGVIESRDETLSHIDFYGCTNPAPVFRIEQPTTINWPCTASMLLYSGCVGLGIFELLCLT